MGERRGAHREEPASLLSFPFFLLFLRLPSTLLISPALSLPLQNPRKESKPLYVFSLLYFPARDRRQEEEESGPQCFVSKTHRYKSFPKCSESPESTRASGDLLMKLIKVMEAGEIKARRLCCGNQINAASWAQYSPPALPRPFLTHRVRNYGREAVPCFPTSCLELWFSTSPLEK